jgi:serine/threonine protein kinase
VRKTIENFELLAKIVFFNFLEDPKDLIRKCLVVDPEKRITVGECLKHPFFNTVVSDHHNCTLSFMTHTIHDSQKKIQNPL